LFGAQRLELRARAEQRVTHLDQCVHIDLAVQIETLLAKTDDYESFPE
jgi:hypothetical protein